MRLNAKQLRVSKPSSGQLAKIERKPIYLVLDNVMDTYNIGSIFRLADAVAAREVILCGQTETPPSSRIHKAAVGTETWVPWKYFRTAKDALDDLRFKIHDLRIIAVEQDPRAMSVNSPLPPSLNLREGTPVAIIVGHETEGISKEALDLADLVIEIPMYGVNKSLNVVVSTGIVLYRLVDVI